MKNNITRNLKCPNCYQDMTLQMVNAMDDSNDYYDYWICKDCIHIEVRDYRYN